MKKRITRDVIVQTAISIANEKGLKNITLKDIADALEIKPPSLYNHLKGIDDLYNILANYGLNKLKECLMEATIGLSGKDALISMSNAYRKFSRDYPSLYESTQLVNTFTDVSIKKLSTDIINIISKIISIYNYSKEENIHIIRTLRSYLHGFISFEQNKLFEMSTSTDESFAAGLELIINGIADKYRSV